MQAAPFVCLNSIHIPTVAIYGFLANAAAVEFAKQSRLSSTQVRRTSFLALLLLLGHRSTVFRTTEIILQPPLDLSLNALQETYATHVLPTGVMLALREKIVSEAALNAWIHLETPERLEAACHSLQERRNHGDELPLFGVPFGVKDNIDAAGMPTTAACPDFAYTPEQSARSVELLINAGAICIGKTNLDQFATGLSGARSPYGACGSVGNPSYVSGGSSSGSGVAVAAGHVTFALGTDTGGSGRIPAGFNGIVGIKPTVGRISSRGLVRNCQSLDCVSVFSKTVSDGMAIMHTIDGFDQNDPYCVKPPLNLANAKPGRAGRFTFGRLPPGTVESFGMKECETLYEAACERLVSIGGDPLELDFSKFKEIGAMMFDGPWIAERRSALSFFTDENSSSLLETTRQILETAHRFSATDAFDALHRLAFLRREVERDFSTMTMMVVPTAPRPFTIHEMNSNPVDLNTKLGHYSYFANMLGLCAIAVPNDVLSCGVPMGVTFLAPPWHDEIIASVAERFESRRQIAASRSAQAS